MEWREITSYKKMCACVHALLICALCSCTRVSIIKKERNASSSPSHLLLYSSVFWWPWQPADEKILGVHLIEAMGRHEVWTDWKDSGREIEQDEGRGLAEWTLCWVISREWGKNVPHSGSIYISLLLKWCFCPQAFFKISNHSWAHIAGVWIFGNSFI